MSCVSVTFLQSVVAFIFLQFSHSYANEPEVKPPRFEVNVGGDYYGRGVSLYSTSIWSVAGPVTEPGFRLRADGLASLYGETNTRVFSNGFLPGSTTALGDLMAGYQYNRGSLWLKFYGGVAFQGQNRFFWDAGQQSASKTGARKLPLRVGGAPHPASGRPSICPGLSLINRPRCIRGSPTKLPRSSEAQACLWVAKLVQRARTLAFSKKESRLINMATSSVQARFSVCALACTNYHSQVAFRKTPAR